MCVEITLLHPSSSLFPCLHSPTVSSSFPPLPWFSLCDSFEQKQLPECDFSTHNMPGAFYMKALERYDFPRKKKVRRAWRKKDFFFLILITGKRNRCNPKNIKKGEYYIKIIMDFFHLFPNSHHFTSRPPPFFLFFIRSDHQPDFIRHPISSTKMI